MLKKIFLINFIVFFLTLTGCSGDMKTVEDKLKSLTTSVDAASEKINAEKFNEYAANNNVRYSLEVNKNGVTVDIHNIQSNINDPLEVIISIQDGKPQASWKALDNKNIYILMRE